MINIFNRFKKIKPKKPSEDTTRTKLEPTIKAKEVKQLQCFIFRKQAHIDKFLNVEQEYAKLPSERNRTKLWKTVINMIPESHGATLSKNYSFEYHLDDKPYLVVKETPTPMSDYKYKKVEV